MKQMFLILLTLSLTAMIACSDGEEENQSIKIGVEALEFYSDCDPFTSPFQSALELIGEWELCAYACGFCDPTQIDTPRVVLLFNGDGTGNASYMSTNFSEELSFLWEMEDTLGQVSVLTDPFIGYANGLQVCEGQIGLSGAPLDGPTYVYCK
jgi:hypothetical protein